MKNWILIITSLCFFGQIALAEEKRQPKGYTIPTIDLSKQTKRQVVIDREKGQYLGHPTTVLLETTRRAIVYPKGHGRGGIVYAQHGRRLTWSKRLPTPKSCTSRRCRRFTGDRQGTKRLIMWSAYPATGCQ